MKYTLNDHGSIHGHQNLKLNRTLRDRSPQTYRVGLWAQVEFSAPTFEPVHEARAGQRAALSV